jgi:hypothetical protein
MVLAFQEINRMRKRNISDLHIGEPALVECTISVVCTKLVSVSNQLNMGMSLQSKGDTMECLNKYTDNQLGGSKSMVLHQLQIL